MGTITQRKKSNGTLSYTAQIRLKQGGKVVHNEARTFSRHALASAWMKRRESELELARASGRKVPEKVTLSVLFDEYVGAATNITPWGRSKTADINRLKKSTPADREVTGLSEADWMSYARERRLGGAGPATVLGDFVWFRQVLLHAAATRGLREPLQILDNARIELLRTRVLSKAKLRERRITAAEEAALLEHFEKRDARSIIPMAEIMRFAIESSRREDEICRLRRADVDQDKSIGWLDDVKHPRHKTGNRRKFRLRAAAMEIIKRQPIADGEKAAYVFPFNPKSVSAAFTRACKVLEIEDLHFHDLRHEATSRLFELGYSIQEVAQFTLHESWATLKRYTHLRPEDVPER
ncbi:site-specific integrase [Acidovorax sp. SUPP2539]|uniref:site-specific integrase n=1 Tax=Acidovorax sp. SUPP2539 TaxID=2920878 RepID=UPI0023DE2160|nr:site-specific integrase [Acidovorax sp. SUPP2539]GKS92262.1 site-specific integrase [Acidovorax sp. SUPP2539]